jgi:protein-disulfide isomerase
MSKRFWLILVGIVIVFGVIFKLQNKNNTPSSTTGSPTNHVEGNGTAKVTLVEYGDYECPFCEQFYPVVKDIAAQYNDKIYFQFRNLPLTQIHQNAFAGARAAEAASLQGKFWQMHDILYDEQSTWSPSNNPQTYFNTYAKNLGLNVAKFQQDYLSDQVNNSINADISAFNQTGNDQATPTFFLDGTKINPTATIDSFTKLINTEIAKKA